jgi:hypothetical protein
MWNIADYVREQTAASGVPEKLSDYDTVLAVVRLLTLASRS